MALRKPSFQFVGKDGSRQQFTSTKNQAAVDRTAAWLISHGAAQNAAVVVCLHNCPVFVWIIWACLEHGIPLVTLNPHLTAAEQKLRLEQLEGKLAVGVIVGQEEASRLEAEIANDTLPHDMANDATHAHAASPSPSLACVETESDASRALASTPLPVSVPCGAVDSHATALASAPAVVMFTSGTTGTPKACALSKDALLASARLSNDSLSCNEDSLWQAALPLCHIGGMQVTLRCLEAGAPFILYEHFDARTALADAQSYGVTHISVVDKMLQNLLAEDAHNVGSTLPRYHCLLLGGSALNPATLEGAQAVGARVFASFGMTETASQVANALVDGSFNGGARLMRGFEARILDPDERGRGSLALKGPSLFSGYLNAQAEYTTDGFFVTGDCASLSNGLLFVHERTQDMFVSGGENIYPAEIERALNCVEGVTASYVFGEADEAWGRRPVAVVETTQDPRTMHERLTRWAYENLSRFNRPERFVLTKSMPRSGIGKIDRVAARALAEQAEITS